jgi:hypothetical protein
MNTPRARSWKVWLGHAWGFNRGNQRGMIESIVLGAIGLGVSVGVIFVANNLRAKMIGIEKGKGVSAELEMVMGRVSQAVAMNAVLCAGPLPGARVDAQCRWSDNVNIRSADFGFTDIPVTPQKVFEFNATACVPKTDVLSADCVPTKAHVALQLVNTAPLISLGILGGSMASGDVDPWAIRMTIGADILIGDKIVHHDGNAVLRRPRMYTHFEVGSGICSRTCVLADGLGTSRTCIGPMDASSDTGSNSGAIIPVRFVNDGPGHLHHFTVARVFHPNPALAPAGSPDLLDTVFDSATAYPGGLAVGQGVSFVDDKTPCYISTAFNYVVSGTQTGTTTTQQVSAHNVSGAVEYYLVIRPDKVDPANVLFMSRGNGSVQAQDRSITQYVPPPPPPPPPVPPTPQPPTPICTTNPSDPSCFGFCQQYPSDPSCVPVDPCLGGCYAGDGGGGGGGGDGGGGGGGGCGGADGGD